MQWASIVGIGTDVDGNLQTCIVVHTQYPTFAETLLKQRPRS